MVKKLLEIPNMKEEANIQRFNSLIKEYDDLIFNAYASKNVENDFVVKQIDDLKQAYLEEKENYKRDTTNITQ